MAAGRRDLEHALRALLALDVGEIGQGPALARHGRLGPRHHLRALEMIGELDQRAWRQDVDIGRRPGRLRTGRSRADQPLPAIIGRDRGRQHAGDGRDRAVESELAEHGVAGQGIRRERADGRHHGERDRQVVMTAFLRQIGRREVDGDALGRQGQPRGDESRPDPLAAFGDGLVGQADEDEGDAAGGNLHLHVDGPRLDALERHRRDPRHHLSPPRSPAKR